MIFCSFHSLNHVVFLHNQQLSLPLNCHESVNWKMREKKREKEREKEWKGEKDNVNEKLNQKIDIHHDTNREQGRAVNKWF